MNYQFPQPYQIVKVNGERGADALPMYPRSEVLALDTSCTDMILAWYITTDDAGCKTKTLYKMDVYNPPRQPNLNDVMERLQRLEERLNEKPASGNIESAQINTDKQPDAVTNQATVERSE